jgi:N-terminal acetyltransferase B complex catalytic subunit
MSSTLLDELNSKSPYFKLRPFHETDIFKFNNINLDQWTENYTTSFYFDYIMQYPEWCIVAEDDGIIAGYLLAKAEYYRKSEDWHSHISAISVAPEYRKSGIAKLLLDYFHKLSNLKSCIFADLYVRISNTNAIDLYKSYGYIIYRRVLDYYSGEEDAFDMRLPLEVDKDQSSIKDAGYSISTEKLFNMISNHSR